MRISRKNYLRRIDLRILIMRALVYFSGIITQKISMILGKITQIRRDRLTVKVMPIRRIILAQLTIP